MIKILSLEAAGANSNLPPACLRERPPNQPAPVLRAFWEGTVSYAERLYRAEPRPTGPKIKLSDFNLDFYTDLRQLGKTNGKEEFCKEDPNH